MCKEVDKTIQLPTLIPFDSIEPNFIELCIEPILRDPSEKEQEETQDNEFCNGSCMLIEEIEAEEEGEGDD